MKIIKLMIENNIPVNKNFNSLKALLNESKIIF